MITSGYFSLFTTFRNNCNNQHIVVYFLIGIGSFHVVLYAKKMYEME